MLEANNEIYKEDLAESDREEVKEKSEGEIINLDKGIKLKTIIDEEKIKPNAKELIDELKILISSATDEFMTEFDKLLKECAEEKDGITEKIFQYVKDKELDKPEFIISEGGPAQKIIDDFGLDYIFYEGDVLLSFQLPKQLAEYWWKGKKNFQYDLGNSEEKGIIKWGDFYKKLMPLIWEQVETFEIKHRIAFNRINEIAQHDPKKYYYVWRIERKKQIQKEPLEIVEFNQ